MFTCKHRSIAWSPFHRRCARTGTAAGHSLQPCTAANALVTCVPSAQAHIGANCAATLREFLCGAEACSRVQAIKKAHAASRICVRHHARKLSSRYCRVQRASQSTNACDLFFVSATQPTLAARGLRRHQRISFFGRESRACSGSDRGTLGSPWCYRCPKIKRCAHTFFCTRQRAQAWSSHRCCIWPRWCRFPVQI